MLTPFVGTLLIFLLIPAALLMAGAAFVVAVDSVVDRHLTPAQRAIGLSMAVGIIPATLLGIYGAGSLGVFDDALNGTERFLTVVGTVAWVVSLRAVKPRAWAIMKKNDWTP